MAIFQGYGWLLPGKKLYTRHMPFCGHGVMSVQFGNSMSSAAFSISAEWAGEGGSK
jgi:hypothetical protein